MCHQGTNAKVEAQEQLNSWLFFPSIGRSQEVKLTKSTFSMHLREKKNFMKSFEYILLLSVLKYPSHCDFIIKIKFNLERGALSPALANLKQREKPTLTYSHITTPIPVRSCVRHYWQNGGMTLNALSLFHRHGPGIKELGFVILSCFFPFLGWVDWRKY